MRQTHFSQRGIERRGVVAVLVAMLLSVLFGIMALALDAGLMRDNRRKVQGASDAAALAAATQIFVNYPAIAASNSTNFDPNGAGAAAALASASANGFPNDPTRPNVTVNIPPQSGPFAGKVGYAEVIITHYQDRAFSRIWNAAALPVTARSVARGRWGGSGLGIVILDPSQSSALNASGTGSVTVMGGAAVAVDSNSAKAVAVTGGGGITAAGFEITGGYTGTLNGPVTTDVPPTPDPLSYLPTPPVPPMGQMTVTGKTYTLTPGRYTTMPNFTSNNEVVLKQASANSAGGIYYLDGCGLKATGANITMDTGTTGGLMIYNNPTSASNSQQVQITGNSTGTVNLSALTDGPYAGILLWQNRTATTPISITGGGNFMLSGTFYAANAMLSVTGGGNAIIGSQYISRSLNLGGNGQITINYSDSGTARIREAVLVE